MRESVEIRCVAWSPEWTIWYLMASRNYMMKRHCGSCLQFRLGKCYQSNHPKMVRYKRSNLSSFGPKTELPTSLGLPLAYEIRYSNVTEFSALGSIRTILASWDCYDRVIEFFTPFSPLHFGLQFSTQCWIHTKNYRLYRFYYEFIINMYNLKSKRPTEEEKMPSKYFANHDCYPL